MQWIEPLTGCAKSQEALLWWLFAGSIAVFVLTPVAVALTIIRLPPDYFTKQQRRPLESWRQPAIRLVLLALKNLLGVVLLLAGIAMLLAPGQGLLTIVVGLILVDFPGKLQFERWLAFRRPVWRSINWLRKRFGRETFERPA